MQNDFIDGALGTKEAVAIVPKVEEKIRNFKGTVFFTRDTHETWYLDTQEGKKLPVPHCIRNTEGWQIRSELDKLRKTEPIDKDTFGSTDLADELVAMNIDDDIGSITFVGLCTDICVISNALLVKAGSGVMTAGIPDSAGVPAGCTQDTLSAIYNDLASVEALFDEYPKEIAAVIVEPVAANMGVVPPKKGFLEGLRKLCSEHGSVLIFDEVITGFRLGLQGAQGYFGIDADLVTYGKIIGAGMPVGAYGGRREIMEMVSPVGAVYQAGTLSGNPVAMAAGIAQLTILKNNPQIYEELNQKSDTFFETMKENARKNGHAWQVNHVGSIGSLFFTEQQVVDYASAKTSDTAEYARYFKYMLDNGIHLAPAQFEAMFVSAAHTEENLAYALQRAENFLMCK